MFESSAVSGVADQLALSATDEQVSQWCTHLELLLRWNKAYNLTAITDPKDVITHHLADSLSVIPYIVGNRVLDVGTGGGFPGIPLAIYYPNKEVILVDTVQKKTRFLRQVVGDLGLQNVQVFHARVEQLKLDESVSEIVSRAFSSISQFVQLTEHLADRHTRWLAMKGKFPHDELKALSGHFAYTSHPLEVPGLDAERHLIQINRKHAD